jgi:RNA polymerase sigma factor (sigma-70 family)
MRDKLNSKWQRIMDELDQEHPEIQTNTFKFLYVGNREFIYDINNETNEETFIEQLEPEPEEDSEGETERVRELGEQMFETLTGKLKTIMEMKYHDNYSLAEIGRQMGMSRQLVFYHHSKAIAQLRSQFLQEDISEED